MSTTSILPDVFALCLQIIDYFSDSVPHIPIQVQSVTCTGMFHKVKCEKLEHLLVVTLFSYSVTRVCEVYSLLV